MQALKNWWAQCLFGFIFSMLYVGATSVDTGEPISAVAILGMAGFWAVVYGIGLWLSSKLKGGSDE